MTRRARSSGAITVDVSDLDGLAELIAAAAKRAPAASMEALDRTVAEVVAEAHANAEAMRDTGALAEHLQADTSGITRRIWSDVREAAFQEYGSPNTGGPNPWLTGPARAGSTRLLTEISRVGDLW